MSYRRTDRVPYPATERIAFALMWIAIAIGTFLRLYGLGKWPLALDEYYIAKSAQSVLDDGIPDFGCGGYYTRGLLPQYLSAGLLALGVGVEAAVRGVSLLSNLLMLPAVYLLGVKLRGPLVGSAAVILVALSIWEIEFSRFGRMYAPFQCVFLWYCVLAHAIMVDGKTHLKPWLYLLSAASVLVWEGGIFLAALNLVPALVLQRRASIRELIIVGVILASCLAFLSTNFRMWGEISSYLPAELMGDVFNRTFRPNYHVLASTLGQTPLWLIGFAAGCACAVWAGWRLRDTFNKDWRLYLLLVTTMVFACFNQFGLILATWVVLPLIRLTTPLGLLKFLRGSYGLALGANLMFWILFALSTTAWHDRFRNFAEGDELRKLFVVLFKFPNVFDSILFEYLEAIPNFTFVMVFFLIAAYCIAVSRARDDKERGLRTIVLIVVLTCVMVGVLRTQYTATRYTFFVIPLVYLIVCHLLAWFTDVVVHKPPLKPYAFATALVALAWISEDHDTVHALHLSSEQTNYRVGFSPPLAEHYYNRSDYRTPAQYVNETAQPQDVIIVTDLGADHYLDRVDYAYKGLETSEFVSVTCDNATRERWTGARLLYTPEALDNVVANAPAAVWVITSSRPEKGVERHMKERYADAMVLLGADGDMAVFKAK